MLCPACNADLSPIEAAPRLMLDRCEACKGLWFDNFELQRLDEAHEAPESPVVQDVTPGTIAVNGTLSEDAGKRACPRCEVVKLRRHYFSWRRDVQVDTCGSCGGTWLDHGELQRLRAEYRNAAEREADAVKHATGKLAPYEAARDAAALTEADAADRQAGVRSMLGELAEKSPLLSVVLDAAVDGLLNLG